MTFAVMSGRVVPLSCPCLQGLLSCLVYRVLIFFLVLLGPIKRLGIGNEPWTPEGDHDLREFTHETARSRAGLDPDGIGMFIVTGY